MFKTPEEIEKMFDEKFCFDYCNRINNFKALNIDNISPENLKEFIHSIRISDEQEYKREVIKVLDNMKDLVYDEIFEECYETTEKNKVIDDIINKLK